MLSAKGLQISLGDGRQIGPLDIHLQQGQIVGLHAPSGWGKTHLARALAGLHPVTGGRILRPAGKVLYLHQAPREAFNPRWTMARALAEGGPWQSDIAKALGLQPAWMRACPATLSGGQLARLALARALFAKPAVLVADEITAELDPLAQAQVWRLLRDLCDRDGLGIIAISHDHALLAQVTDKGGLRDLAQG